MNIHIIYASYSGTTEAATSQIALELNNLSHTVHIHNAREIHAEEIPGYESIILGSNTWNENNEEGMMNQALIDLKKQLDPHIFAHKPMGVFGLGDSSQYIHFCKAADHLENWVKEAGGILIVPALRIDQYYSKHEENTVAIKNWAQLFSDALPHTG
jgi:flavodoxin I